MSQLLGLHHEMVLLILAQCNSRGWIDGRGQPTESGIALLEEDEDRNLDLRTGLLFRDAISNTFWPRIVSDLEEIERKRQKISTFFPTTNRRTLIPSSPTREISYELNRAHTPLATAHSALA
jgi:hypothetical protein